VGLNIVYSLGSIIMHYYIIQVVKWLLNAGVNINAKNLGGFTALDMLQGQTQIKTVR
jgi:hypothetical protein